MAGLGKAIISPLGAALGIIKTPKPTVAVATPVATRDAAADAARRDDELRRRRGAGANVLTGAGGAEASTPGAKTLLGQ